MKFTNDELYSFINRASLATYAGGGSYDKIVERHGFLEMSFEDGMWHYRDSYVGYYRSGGSEVVRYNNEVIWMSNYCGGLTQEAESISIDTFNFLKKAMLAKPKDKQSFRGPDYFQDGVYSYSYQQRGDVLSYSGYEEIQKDSKPIFSHEIIGGIIKNKSTYE